MALKNQPINPHVERFRKSQIYQTIWARAAKEGKTIKNVIDAAEWFRNKAKMMGKDVTPEDLMSDQGKQRLSFDFGSMYSFFYIPKHKDDISALPYYDIFPLVFPVQPAKGGFYGINMHYLPPTLRAALMDELFTLRSSDRFDDRTKLVLSYQVLKKASKMSAFAPCFKHYLIPYVYSQFLYIEPSDWNIALFLPTERFVRASKQQVWQRSRKAF